MHNEIIQKHIVALWQQRREKSQMMPNSASELQMLSETVANRAFLAGNPQHSAFKEEKDSSEILSSFIKENKNWYFLSTFNGN